MKSHDSRPPADRWLEPVPKAERPGLAIWLRVLAAYSRRLAGICIGWLGCAILDGAASALGWLGVYFEALADDFSAASAEHWQRFGPKPPKLAAKRKGRSRTGKILAGELDPGR
jgi:hypothetical protein